MKGRGRYQWTLAGANSVLKCPGKLRKLFLMRITLFLATLMGAVALQAAEPLVMPDFVKNFEELEEAQKEAAEAKKGITFLLMAPGST